MRGARAVAVLAKVPARGRVKTRLVPAIGEERAVALARAMLLDTLEALDRLDPAVTRVLAASGALQEAQALAPPRWRVVAQVEGDLGARIAHAWTAGQASRVAIVGADAPSMSAARVESALDRLDDADAAIGPVLDGGYDLIALPRLQPALLDAMPWSTPELVRVTRARARAAGLVLAELDVGFDVDTPEDLSALPRWLDTSGAPARHTRAWLRDLATGS